MDTMDNHRIPDLCSYNNPGPWSAMVIHRVLRRADRRACPHLRCPSRSYIALRLADQPPTSPPEWSAETTTKQDYRLEKSHEVRQYTRASTEIRRCAAEGNGPHEEGAHGKEEHTPATKDRHPTSTNSQHPRPESTKPTSSDPAATRHTSPRLTHSYFTIAWPVLT